jgi:hypothetical protein
VLIWFKFLLADLFLPLVVFFLYRDVVLKAHETAMQQQNGKDFQSKWKDLGYVAYIYDMQTLDPDFSTILGQKIGAWSQRL